MPIGLCLFCIFKIFRCSTIPFIPTANTQPHRGIFDLGIFFFFWLGTGQRWYQWMTSMISALSSKSIGWPPRTSLLNHYRLWSNTQLLEHLEIVQVVAAVLLEAFLLFQILLGDMLHGNGMQYFQRKEKRLFSHSWRFLKTLIHWYISFMLCLFHIPACLCLDYKWRATESMWLMST